MGAHLEELSPAGGLRAHHQGLLFQGARVLHQVRQARIEPRKALVELHQVRPLSQGEAQHRGGPGVHVLREAPLIHEDDPVGEVPEDAGDLPPLALEARLPRLGHDRRVVAQGLGHAHGELGEGRGLRVRGQDHREEPLQGVDPAGEDAGQLRRRGDVPPRRGFLRGGHDLEGGAPLGGDAVEGLLDSLDELRAGRVREGDRRVDPHLDPAALEDPVGHHGRVGDLADGLGEAGHQVHGLAGREVVGPHVQDRLGHAGLDAQVRLELRVDQRVADDELDALAGREGLGQVVVDPALERVHHGLHGRIARHHQEDGVLGDEAALPHELQPVQLGHLEIHQGHLGMFVLQDPQALPRIGAPQDLDVRALEVLGEELHHRGFVVDDEDCGARDGREVLPAVGRGGGDRDVSHDRLRPDPVRRPGRRAGPGWR